MYRATSNPVLSNRLFAAINACLLCSIRSFISKLICMAKQRSNSHRAGKRRTSSTKLLTPETQYVSSDNVLKKICKQIHQEGCFAFDTEFVMEDCFGAEVCLVQLATESLVAVVDPLEVKSLKPVWELVGDPNVEVIVHAGMEDLALCQIQGGVTPQNVFDCQVACGLVSVDYPLSLSKITRSMIGVRLHKSQTLTDWRRRPLSKEQVRYAADDVIYLPAVHKSLSKKLERKGRNSWLLEEMERFCKAETYLRSDDEKVFRLKGSGVLDGQGLAIARELVKARDELAAKYNRPIRGVIRDHLIIEIAKHRWVNPADIKTLRGLNLRADGIQKLAVAAKHACDMPREQWPVPTPPKDETDQEAAMTLLAGAIVRAYCAQHCISHQLVASKKDLGAFVQAVVRKKDNTDLPLPMQIGWRGQTVGSVVQEVLAGRATVGLREDKDGLTVVVQ